MSYGLYLLASPVPTTNAPDLNTDASMRPSSMDAARETIEQLEAVAPSEQGLEQQRNCVAAIAAKYPGPDYYDQRGGDPDESVWVELDMPTGDSCVHGMHMDSSYTVECLLPVIALAKQHGITIAGGGSADYNWVIYPDGSHVGHIPQARTQTLSKRTLHNMPQPVPLDSEWHTFYLIPSITRAYHTRDIVQDDTWEWWDLPVAEKIALAEQWMGMRFEQFEPILRTKEWGEDAGKKIPADTNEKYLLFMEIITQRFPLKEMRTTGSACESYFWQQQDIIWHPDDMPFAASMVNGKETITGSVPTLVWKVRVKSRYLHEIIPAFGSLTGYISILDPQFGMDLKRLYSYIHPNGRDSWCELDDSVYVDYIEQHYPAELLAAVPLLTLPRATWSMENREINQASKILREMLEPLINAHGFKFSPTYGAFMRKGKGKDKGCEQRIRLNVSKRCVHTAYAPQGKGGGGVYITLYNEANFPKMTNEKGKPLYLYTRMEMYDWLNADEIQQPNAFVCWEQGLHCYFARVADLEETLRAEILPQVERYLLPLADKQFGRENLESALLQRNGAVAILDACERIFDYVKHLLLEKIVEHKEHFDAGADFPDTLGFKCISFSGKTYYPPSLLHKDMWWLIAFAIQRNELDVLEEIKELIVKMQKEWLDLLTQTDSSKLASSIQYAAKNMDKLVLFIDNKGVLEQEE